MAGTRFPPAGGGRRNQRGSRVGRMPAGVVGAPARRPPFTFARASGYRTFFPHSPPPTFTTTMVLLSAGSPLLASSYTPGEIFETCHRRRLRNFRAPTSPIPTITPFLFLFYPNNRRPPMSGSAEKTRRISSASFYFNVKNRFHFYCTFFPNTRTEPSFVVFHIIDYLLSRFLKLTRDTSPLRINPF